jgi:hypothetical protein
MLRELTLNSNALIDLETFYHMYKMLVNSSLDEDDADRKITITWAINAVSAAFERFCNRPLVARDYTYEVGHTNYNDNMSVFDPPPSNIFWFPTYPVNSITTFLVYGSAVTASTNNLATDGYILYNRIGKLIYEQGFYYGYYKTIQVKWNGGYLVDSVERDELQNLCFKMIKALLAATANPMVQSETIGGYQYQLFSPFVISQMKGLAPDVLQALGKYRREPIG